MKACTYFSFRILIILILNGIYSNCLFSQISISCGMTDNTPLSSLPEGTSCSRNASNIISDHKEEIIPISGMDLLIPVNFVIVHNEAGEMNFDLDDPNQLQFLRNIGEKMNGRMDNLVNETCDCQSAPNYFLDSKISFDVEIFSLRSNIWDHSIHDPTPVFNLSCPLNPQHYVKRLYNEYVQSPNFRPGFTLFFTHGSQGSAKYKGFWYSGIRCSTDYEHPALSHAPGSFGDYLWIVNGNGQPNQTISWLENLQARSAAHEFFHQLQSTVGHKHQCQFNLMNGSSQIGPAPDAQNPNTALTGCQLREAFGTMMANHMAKYVPCQESFSEEIIITKNEVWDNRTRIFSDIRIKSGFTLTVKCIIELQQNAKIIVEKGGTLILDEGHLKSCGEWQGIKVEGDAASASQVNAGKVILRNNAIIENARTAISMNPGHIPWPQIQGHWGGLVQAENSTIRNCNRAVEFMKYGTGLTNDESYFKNCTFENMSHSAVTIWSDNGVVFDGCTFNNVTENGIYAYDSKVEVYNRCIFSNIFTGINVFHTYPAFFSSVIGKESNLPNEFLCDKYGVYARTNGNAAALQIVNNSFAGGDYGVHIDGYSAYHIAHNDFIGGFTAVEPVSTGSTHYNNVEYNNISSSTIGSHPVFDNYNLLYADNCFGYNVTSDIFVNSGTIFIQQGDENLANGNCFSKGGVPEIDNSSNPPIQFWIWKDEPLTSCEYPTVVANDASYNVVVNKNSIGENGDNCGSMFTSGVINTRTFCNGPFKNIQEIQNKINEVKAIIAAIESNTFYSQNYKNYLIAIYKRCLAKLNKDIIVIILEPDPTDIGDDDEGMRIESAIQYTSQMDDFNHKLYAYGLMVESNQLNRARSYLNGLTTSNTEQVNFIQAQNIYLDFLQNRSNYQLTAADHLRLVNIGNGRLPLDGYARSIYEVITGNKIELEIPSAGSTLRPRSSEVQKKIDIINIYPNPSANGQLNIFIESSDQSTYNVVVYDLFGRIVYVKSVTGGVHTISTLQWTEGIYIVDVADENGNKLKVQKIVVTH